MRPTDRMKVYNRQFVARTATTDRVMRTTDREYVHTTVSLNKKHNERDDEMVQLTKMILKQTARHRRASALLRNIQNIRICMGKKTYRFCNPRK